MTCLQHLELADKRLHVCKDMSSFTSLTASSQLTALHISVTDGRHMLLPAQALRHVLPAGSCRSFVCCALIAALARCAKRTLKQWPWPVLTLLPVVLSLHCSAAACSLRTLSGASCSRCVRQPCKGQL